jgi:hypothetical protein
MTRLFQGLLGLFLPGLAARPAAWPPAKLHEAGGPLADPLFHSRYRDELAIFESALISADLRTLDDAAAKLTRMQNDFSARPAGPSRASKETS